MQTEIKPQLYNNPLEELGCVPADHLQQMIVSPVRAAHRLLNFQLHKIKDDSPVRTFEFKDAVGFSFDCIMDYLKSYNRKPIILDNQIAVRIELSDVRGFTVVQTLYSLPFRGNAAIEVQKWLDSYVECRKEKSNATWVAVTTYERIEVTN